MTLCLERLHEYRSTLSRARSSVARATHSYRETMGISTKPLVVMLAYYYPPHPAVGGLRARKVARALAHAGFSVHVVTASGDEHPPCNDFTDSCVVVHRVKPHPSPRDLTLRLSRLLKRSRLRAVGESTAVSERARPKADGAPSRWRRYLYSLLWLPDDVQGFILPASRLARKLLRRQRGVLYSTAPPFSPHLAAYLAIVGTGTRWVLELRDPWSDNPQKPSFMRSVGTDAVDAALERMCLRKADLIVAVSDGIASALRQKLPSHRSERLITVRNGIDEVSTPPPLPKRPFRIIHAGTCSYGRDPRPFLRTLARVMEGLQLGPGDIEATFLGECTHFAGTDLLEFARSLGLGEVARFPGVVPRETALHLVGQSHLLLVLAQDQPDQVPNKLYEYLGTGRPILAYADEEGEVAKLLRRLQGHHVTSASDSSGTEEFLRHSIQEGIWRTPEDPAALQELGSASQLGRLVTRITSFSSEGA
jgi:hypothetical protein